MPQTSETKRKRLQKLLIPVAIVFVGLVAAVLFNTHVVRTDGPGPIGYALAVYIILMLSSKRDRVN